MRTSPRTPAWLGRSRTYVLTGEEIRSAGHLAIAEALRLVPGVYLARMNANIWSISTRAFNSRLANRQLVQIDGRTIYDLTSTAST